MDITEKELNTFRRIYNYNFNTNLNNSLSPSLLAGLEIIKEDDRLTDDYKSFEINDLLQSNNGRTVYTPAFKKIIENLDKVIQDESKETTMKIILIGKYLKENTCNKGDFNKRLIKHFLDYIDKIIYNKSKLLNEMGKLVKSCVIKIGKCDYENFEAFSNKSIEHSLRNMSKLLPEVLSHGTRFIGNIPKMGYNSMISAYDPQAEIEKVKQIPSSTVPTIVDIVRETVHYVRTETMALHGLHKQDFCCATEYAKTYENSEASSYWLTVPRLSAMIMASSTIATNYSLAVNSLSKPSDLALAIHTNLSTAAFITTALGPLLGLLISIGVGLLIESDFWKNLRSSRLVLNEFNKFIRDNNFKPIVESQSLPCSFRTSETGYSQTVQSAYNEIKEYHEKAKNHFNNHIEKLYLYLYIYHISCKIDKIFYTSTNNDDDDAENDDDDAENDDDDAENDDDDAILNVVTPIKSEQNEKEKEKEELLTERVKQLSDKLQQCIPEDAYLSAKQKPKYMQSNIFLNKTDSKKNELMLNKGILELSEKEFNAFIVNFTSCYGTSHDNQYVDFAININDETVKMFKPEISSAESKSPPAASLSVKNDIDINGVIRQIVMSYDTQKKLATYLTRLYNELDNETKRNDFLEKLDLTLTQTKKDQKINSTSDGLKPTNRENLVENMIDFYSQNNYPKDDGTKNFYGGRKINKQTKRRKQTKRTKRTKRRTSRK